MVSAKILTIMQKYHDQLSRTQRAIIVKKALKVKGSTEDKVTLSRKGKRKELIHKLSREIINNLIVSEEPPEIAKEIKEKVEEKVGMRLFFEFDPKEKRVIVRKENKMRVSKDEERTILEVLEKLTEDKLEQMIS